jgi:outer membrane receptor protein involved in Fe transport
VVAKGRTDAQGNPIPGTDSVLALLGGTVATGDQTDNYETTLNQLPVSTARDRGLSAEVKWDLNDDATFVSISAWRKYNSFDSIDSDFSDVDIIRTANDAHQESFSQELRLDYTGDKLNAVVGLYYFQQDLDLNYTLTGGDALDPYAGLAFGLDAFVQGMNAISAATGGLFPQAASAYPNDFEAFHTASQEHESWAIFGQFDYSVTDDIILTMGLRYTEEEKDLRTVFNESIGGEVWNAGPQTSLAQVGAAGVALGQLGADLAVGDPSKLFDPTFVGQFAPYTVAGWGGWLFPGLTPRDDVIAELTDEQITGTLKLAWQVNDNSMIYASYGTGYKSGGTNTDRIPLGFNPVFDAETSESFEVGAKLEFPDQALRINTAAHYTTVDDFQENTFAGNGFILQNAGELETYGAELDVFWKPADNTTITFAYAYTVADFKSFEKGNCWNAYSWHNGVADPGATPGEAFCDRSGDRVSMNPEHNGTLGIQQDFVLSDSLEGYIYGEYSFLSDMVLDANNDPFKVQDDYGLVNLRAGLSFTELDLDVTLWVRNALDENYKRTTFDVPVQSGKLMAYPSVPRTFGLTLNKAF